MLEGEGGYFLLLGAVFLRIAHILVSRDARSAARLIKTIGCMQPETKPL
jgi:hypothetical protein